MGFTLQQQKTTTLSLFVLAGCWTWRKNGFLFVVTQHTAVLWSCFSPVWQNPFFYRSWWLDWDHNDTRCSIMEALHFARLSVIFNFISSCGRKQTRLKHWCVNVSSSLVVKTPYRMESQVPHQCLMNVGVFFFTAPQRKCLVGVRNYFTWTTTSFSSGINSSKRICFWSKMMSRVFRGTTSLYSDFYVAESFLVRCRMIQEDTWDWRLLYCQSYPNTSSAENSLHWLSPISTTLDPDPYHPLSVSPPFASQLSALSMYHPFKFSPNYLPYRAKMSLYFHTFTFQYDSPPSSFSSLLDPVLSWKGQIKTGEASS